MTRKPHTGLSGAAQEAYLAGMHHGRMRGWLQLARASSADAEVRALYVDFARASHRAYVMALRRARRLADAERRAYLAMAAPL